MAIELLDDAQIQVIERSLIEWPVERLTIITTIAETLVKSHLPSATLYYSVDRKGKQTHIGIYRDAPTLNHLGYFMPLQQKAPQLLGERMVYRDDYSAWYKAYQLGNLWSGAAFALNLTIGDIERHLTKMNIKY